MVRVFRPYHVKLQISISVCDQTTELTRLDSGQQWSLSSGLKRISCTHNHTKSSQCQMSAWRHHWHYQYPKAGKIENPSTTLHWTYISQSCRLSNLMFDKTRITNLGQVVKNLEAINDRLASIQVDKCVSDVFSELNPLTSWRMAWRPHALGGLPASE